MATIFPTTQLPQRSQRGLDGVFDMSTEDFYPKQTTSQPWSLKLRFDMQPPPRNSRQSMAPNDVVLPSLRELLDMESGNGTYSSLDYRAKIGVQHEKTQSSKPRRSIKNVSRADSAHEMQQPRTIKLQHNVRTLDMQDSPSAQNPPSNLPLSSTTSSGPYHNLTLSGSLYSRMHPPHSECAKPARYNSPYSQPPSTASSCQLDSSRSRHFAGQQPSVGIDELQLLTRPITSEPTVTTIAPSGQSNIKLMTIKSQQGHSVHIPVDVQAASKVADAKRRRNAGASARFRARRKEKERETSIKISLVEQQLRNANDAV